MLLHFLPDTDLFCCLSRSEFSLLSSFHQLGFERGFEGVLK